MTAKPLRQDEGPRRVAGLQATQELPGFLLHEELVPGAPAGHRLPGAGHLGGGKGVTTQAVAGAPREAWRPWLGWGGDISITLPPSRSHNLCSLHLPGGPAELVPSLGVLRDRARRLDQDTSPHPPQCPSCGNSPQGREKSYSSAGWRAAERLQMAGKTGRGSLSSRTKSQRHVLITSETTS